MQLKDLTIQNIFVAQLKHMKLHFSDPLANSWSCKPWDQTRLSQGVLLCSNPASDSLLQVSLIETARG